MFKQYPVANEKETDFRNAFYNFRCRVHQLIVAFQREKPCDLTDDRGALGNSKFLSDLARIKFGIQKPVEFHTAVYRPVFLRFSDPGRERLFGHYVTYRYEIIRDGGAYFFRGT